MGACISATKVEEPVALAVEAVVSLPIIAVKVAVATVVTAAGVGLGVIGALPMFTLLVVVSFIRFVVTFGHVGMLDVLDNIGWSLWLAMRDVGDLFFWALWPPFRNMN